MTLFTYLIERINKYKFLNPVEFQELELKSRIVYVSSEMYGYITQNPFHIEFENTLPINGAIINMYNGNYKYSFVCKICENDIKICQLLYETNVNFEVMLTQVIEWFCKICNYTYIDHCFIPKS